MAHILIVDDEKNYRIILTRLLTEAGYQVTTEENPFAALEVLARENVDLVISDLRMPRMDGMEFFRTVKQQYASLPVVIMTAFATVETALQAMKQGVFDYLTKPFKNDEILLVVGKALEFARLRKENDLLRRQLGQSETRELLGDSPSMRQLRDEIRRIGPAPSSVLITGESGTGKELVARGLHRASQRSDGAMVCVNCAAFSENLLESELFGHERGAFTGAGERKRGLLEMAAGGTLFLDEIGEMSLALQPKLLRVLQERSFRRIGGSHEISCDVRIIAATNRDLVAMIASGQFREDLYYRLNVIPLKLPPLRERSEDIPLLAFHFLNFFSRKLGRSVQGFAADTLSLLQAYDWPGNIRELQNVIERGVIFCRGEQLLPDDLPASLSNLTHAVTDRPVAQPGFDKPLPEKLDDFEASLVRQAMVEARGIQASAAKLLGISRSNLQYKLRKFGLSSD